MNTRSPATMRRSKPLLLAVAAAIVMGIGTYWLLQWLSRVPGWLGPAQLPIAVILLLGGGAYLISSVRAATSGIDTAWSRTLPFVAPVLVLGVIGFVWSDRRPEPTNSEALDQPIPALPATDDKPRTEAEPYAPPVSPVPASELAEPKPGEPVDR